VKKRARKRGRGPEVRGSCDVALAQLVDEGVIAVTGTSADGDPQYGLTPAGEARARALRSVAGVEGTGEEAARAFVVDRLK
jgi:hypothetical protein